MRSRLTWQYASVCAALLAAACGGSTTVTEIVGPDAAARCQTSLSAPPQSLPAAGNRVTLTVLAARECTWTASSEAAWLEISPTSGQGEASVTLTVAANPEGRPRTGAVVINGNRLSLSQEPAPCRYDISPASIRLSHEGERATFRITATEACGWRAASNQSWARVLTDSGTSSATVQVDVSRNEGRAIRSATITIADRSATIEQEFARPPTPTPAPPSNPALPCVPSIDSSERSFPASGGEGSFRVNIAPGCRWSASSNVNWVDLTGSNGTGPDTVRYRVTANNNASPRTAAVTIGNQTHTVRQDGAPATPPPGNGNGQRVELSGRAFFVDGSCPNLTFVVDFRHRVFTNGETNFKGDCRRLRSGRDVSVEGRIQPDGRVRATRVEIDDDDDD